MTTPRAIVEVRDGGEVRAALVLERDGDRLHLLTSDGREIRVPRARIVNTTGAELGADTPRNLATQLRAWEVEADTRSRAVDLPALHELLADGSAGDLGLSDLAALALGEDTPLARSGVHRAMARPNAWFRFTGQSWLRRSDEDVAAELEKDRRTREVAAAREGFVAAARARVRGENLALPEGSAKFVRPLKDLVIEGDACKTKREAGVLFAEIEGRAAGKEPAVPTVEQAFEMLVSLGLFGRDENLALIRAGVSEKFSDEALAIAIEASRREPGEGRLDFRQLEIVTIDDAATTEVDDGLSLERTGSGAWRIGVHISDAAHFVDAGTALDDEAMQRATSYYLPDRVLRMLPDVLAENAASLVEGADRPAISFFAEMTPHGEILRTEIVESVIRVRQRLTYEGCEAALEGKAGPEWLVTLADLAGRLEASRLAAGASPIRAFEIAIEFDEAGAPLIKLIDPGRPARTLVSEMMILANVIAAEWCKTRGLPAIFRKQPAPTKVVPPPPRDRIDVLAAHDFRRTLQRTEVSLEPGPHAGLGVPCYLQATSPIRRYQDLAMHRIIKASLRGERSPVTREQLQGIAVLTEQAGRQARSVETETDHYWILRYLEAHVGDELEAMVLRAEDRRTLIEILPLAFQAQLAPRPDHQKGQLLRVKVRGAIPRRGTLVLEQLA